MRNSIFVFFLISFSSFSQSENQKIINGVVYNDNSYSIEGIHVLNITSNEATITDYQGNFKILININDDRKVFFIHGGVDVDQRELVREITEREINAIIVASYGTFSTGINIKNLHNVIFASPSKSRIRNLQSIGRVLRKGSNKFKATDSLETI